VITFRPVAFRPHVPSPTLGAERALGQTFDEIMGWSPTVGDVLRLTFHGIATYLGIVVGLNATKLKLGNRTTRQVTAGLGWALAAGQGLGAIADIISLGKRALGVHPPEKLSPPVSDVAPIPPVR
jgi:hypothetical protein